MNDFGCKHSDKLQEYFDIEGRGIDYFNDSLLAFEFKESWAKDLNKMFFKVPKIQLLASDFIIFCVYDKQFYVHKSRAFLNKYPFDSEYGRCCLRYSTIKKNYVRKFDNYDDLKRWVDSL